MRREHDPERGATLVEYSLLLALAALVLVPAVSWLRDATMTVYARAVPGAEIADGPTTTTTAPPPTTSPSPTSAPPPTTSPPATTAPPATAPPATAPPVVAKAGFGSVTSSSVSWYQWAGSAAVVVTDAQGRPLAGARVQVLVTPVGGGSPVTATVTTDSTGRATVEVGPYDALWGYGTTRVDLRITGVTPTSGTWDGNGATTSVRAP